MINLSLQGANQQQKDMIEQAASVISEDNTELACAFIQKTAVEKALPEMDKRLTTVSVIILAVCVHVFYYHAIHRCMLIKGAISLFAPYKTSVKLDESTKYKHGGIEKH